MSFATGRKYQHKHHDEYETMVSFQPEAVGCPKVKREMSTEPRLWSWVLRETGHIEEKSLVSGTQRGPLVSRQHSSRSPVPRSVLGCRDTRGVVKSVGRLRALERDGRECEYGLTSPLCLSLSVCNMSVPQRVVGLSGILVWNLFHVVRSW